MKSFSDYYEQEISRHQSPRKRNPSAKPTKAHKNKIKYLRNKSIKLEDFD